MITAYYKNSRGEILDLIKYPYLTAEADWFNSDWEENDSGYQMTVQVDVYGNGDDFRVKEGWQGYVYSEVELTFVAPELSWVTEVTKQFFPQDDSTADTGLDFPYDHPFEFAEDDTGSQVWDIDHVGSSEFQMIMYGPCTNPYVMLNGHSYSVYTDLEQDEYLIIDSQNCTVLKHQSDGMIQNLFNERGLDDSVFEPVPSGLLRISWPGTFGFDLTLFLKRREARW